MVIFDNNPVLVYAVLGCSISSAIGLSFLLIRISLRDQAKALLRERLDFVVKRPSKPSVEHQAIFLRKQVPLQSEDGNKLAEYFRVRLGMQLNPKLLIAVLVFLSILIPAFIASYFFLGTYLILYACLGVLFIIVGVFWILKFRRDRFLMKCEAQLPDALDFIVRSLKAGHAFSTSISLVGEELPPPLGPEFRRVFKEQKLGVPLSTALLELTKRTPTMDFRYFVTAYLVNREIGGNLSEVLENISRLIRERFKLRAHVQAITAEGRWSAWVISLLPIATVAAIFTIRPEYFRLLVEEPFGQKLILIAIGMWFMGIVVTRRLVHVDY
ncbi:MAG: type II secretion system F family protein [Candidatus Brocadiales bacterium]